MITISFDELERSAGDLAARSFRNHTIVPGAMPPVIVFASARERFYAGELWFWCAPRLFLLSSENRIIGSGCFKNSPHNGTIEICCGIAESHRGRNFATRGIEQLVAEGLLKPEVNTITAKTAVWNLASQRVLEKASFHRTGSRVDPEDGSVITWQRERKTGKKDALS